jgi:hypothetical protein
MDLEWVIAGPIEMLRVPSWLSGKQVDKIQSSFDEFDQIRTEFMDVLKDQEKESESPQNLS